MSIQILDIYIGNRFDADREKGTGTDGVIIKGGQGHYPEYFSHRSKFIDECRRVGLPWGIYWLCDARYDPEGHKSVIRTYFPDGDFGPLGLWLDCEKPRMDMKDREYMKLPYAFYKPIESIWRGIQMYTGIYPNFYTSPGAWNLIFGGMPKSLADEFAQKSRLWTAQYGVSSPDLYGSWADWVMWQYQEGPDYSIAKEDWWNSIIKQQPLPVPPPVPEMIWGIDSQTQNEITLKRGAPT